MEKIVENLRFVPKLWTAIGYALLVALSLVLFFGRKYEAIKIPSILEVLPDFYDHVSNLSLSLIIYTMAGYIGILVGLRVRHIALGGIVIVLINIVVELFVPVLNTPDKIDLLYGVSGAVLGFAFLCMAKLKGLRPNIEQKRPEI